MQIRTKYKRTNTVLRILWGARYGSPSSNLNALGRSPALRRWRGLHPWGNTPRRFPPLFSNRSLTYCCQVKTPQICQHGAARIQSRCATDPSRAILVVADGIGFHAPSTEVLIHHETNFCLQKRTPSREQNQAGNAVSECQP
jgi:hypothetical protein